MKKIIKLPRVLKINWIKETNISVVFNNGESRIIDFGKLIEELARHHPELKKLLNESELAQASLRNGTLSWTNVEAKITGKDGKAIFVPFEVGADTLFYLSKPEKSNLSSRIGRLIREARKKAGMTQQELAMKSGTTRNYISRIENDRSGIELDTLRKIIEIGLGKKMEIDVK
jgi:DNA-binding XRE family transcriptional regulator